MTKLILPGSRGFSNDDDDDFEYEDEGPEPYVGPDQQDEDDGEQEPRATARFQPVWTGLLTEDGRPIIKHPVVMRMGFHPEASKFYVPTLEEDDGPIIGWTYGVL